MARLIAAVSSPWLLPRAPNHFTEISPSTMRCQLPLGLDVGRMMVASSSAAVSPETQKNQP